MPAIMAAYAWRLPRGLIHVTCYLLQYYDDAAGILRSIVLSAIAPHRLATSPPQVLAEHLRYCSHSSTCRRSVVARVLPLVYHICCLYQDCCVQAPCIKFCLDSISSSVWTLWTALVHMGRSSSYAAQLLPLTTAGPPGAAGTAAPRLHRHVRRGQPAGGGHARARGCIPGQQRGAG
jgi:hypothetical protein